MGNMNKLVHECRSYDAGDSVVFILDLLQRFDAAQVLFTGTRPPDEHSEWRPPAPGEYKANFDASINSFGAGLGVLIRDSESKIVAWRRRRIPFIKCPEIGEALAARCAVELARDKQLQHVVFEGDCKGIIEQLCSSVQSLSAAGSIISEIKRLIYSFNSAYFTFIKRSGNNLAHIMAKDIELDVDGNSELPVAFV